MAAETRPAGHARTWREVDAARKYYVKLPWVTEVYSTKERADTKEDGIMCWCTKV